MEPFLIIGSLKNIKSLQYLQRSHSPTCSLSPLSPLLPKEILKTNVWCSVQRDQDHQDGLLYRGHYQNRQYKDVDSFSHLFQFCSPIERRYMSQACKSSNIGYKRVAEDISISALTKIVRERKEMWKLPAIYNDSHEWSQCLPPIAISRKK